jgi:hypothetical protein
VGLGTYRPLVGWVSDVVHAVGDALWATIHAVGDWLTFPAAGSYGDWLGGVGTTLVAIYGTFAFLREREDRVLRADRELDAWQTKRRAQARLVWVQATAMQTFWADETSGTRLVRGYVKVSNDSDEVITECVAKGRLVETANHQTVIAEGEVGPQRINPNTPHDFKVDAHLPGDVGSRFGEEWDWLVEVYFTDSAGIEWVREPDHRLREVYKGKPVA